jgi:hypothetical protein
MPRLPTPDDVSGARRPTLFSPDGTVAQADTSMVGLGLKHIGQGIENAASGFGKMFAAYKSSRDEASSIYVERQMGEFLDNENKLYDEAVKNLKPEEAPGFAQRWNEESTARKKEFAKGDLYGLPDPVHHRYDTKLRSHGEQTLENAQKREKEAYDFHVESMLDDVVNKEVRQDLVRLSTMEGADYGTELARIKGKVDGLIDGLDKSVLEKSQKRKEFGKLIEKEFAMGLPPEKRVELHPSRTSELDTDMGNVAAFIRARGVPATGMDKGFAGKLALALQWAEEETGATGRIVEGHRDSGVQAQYYANYTGRPVVWEGRTYEPQKRGGRAAPPGRSRHQRGTAADLASTGSAGKPFWRLREEWDKDKDAFRQKFGLEFLNVSDDKVHIQLAGGGRDSNSLERFAAGAPGARPDVIGNSEGRLSADAFTELSFDELSDIAESGEIDLRRMERNASRDTSQETRAQAFDLFRDDELTQDWLDAHREDLGNAQYEKYTKRLDPSTSTAKSDPRETLRLFDLAETAPEQAEEEGREAWLRGDINKADYFKLRRKADGDPSEASNPDAKAARQWLSSSLTKARDIKYGGYSIAHESEYTAAQKVLNEYDTWSKAHPDAKPAEASAVAEKIWSAEIQRKASLGKRGELPMPRFAPAGISAATLTPQHLQEARERLLQAGRSSVLTADQLATEQKVLELWEGVLGGKPK